MMYDRSTIKIVIADDHELFRDGFKVLLKNQEELELVGEAENGKELLDIVGMHQPDVAIIDIRMPLMDGLEACLLMKRKFPDVKVIALSMFNDDKLVVDMLEAGAKGYLLKNTNKKELLNAVKSVYEGATYYCSGTSDKLTRMIGESRFNPYRKQPVKKFTSREIEILQLVCQQYTNKEIADKIGISFRTVETYREKIQEKTGSRNSVGMVIYAIKNKICEI